jgi:hypothetical protein
LLGVKRQSREVRVYRYDVVVKLLVRNALIAINDAAPPI